MEVDIDGASHLDLISIQSNAKVVTSESGEGILLSLARGSTDFLVSGVIHVGRVSLKQVRRVHSLLMVLQTLQHVRVSRLGQRPLKVEVVPLHGKLATGPAGPCRSFRLAYSQW